MKRSSWDFPLRRSSSGPDSAGIVPYLAQELGSVHGRDRRVWVAKMPARRSCYFMYMNKLIGVAELRQNLSVYLRR